jgi:hypothetical protein
MKPASVANTGSDLLQKWQKFLRLLAAIIHVLNKLVPNVQPRNLMG